MTQQNQGARPDKRVFNALRPAAQPIISSVATQPAGALVQRWDGCTKAAVSGLQTPLRRGQQERLTSLLQCLAEGSWNSLNLTWPLGLAAFLQANRSDEESHDVASLSPICCRCLALGFSALTISNVHMHIVKLNDVFLLPPTF